MFYLHASNRTENLLRQFAELTRADPQDSPFGCENILIQSQGMERMISQYMAKFFSCWFNYRFLLPLTLLEDVAEKLGMSVTPDSYSRDFMTWRIEEHLRNTEDNAFAPLHHYLSGGQRDLKRYQLARSLAHCFDQYQLMRPGILQGWVSGKTSTLETSEPWQMELWKRLAADPAGGRHRGDVLYGVIDALRSGKAVTGLPKRISLFGIHILPPFYLDFLEGLSHHCDIHLFLLSPCRKYWGDIRRKTAGTAGGATGADHPLLALNGAQGRDFQELLIERVSFHREFTSYEDLPEEKNDTLLQALQQGMLEGMVVVRQGVKEEDTSIRVIACHSRIRELEVMRDHVLHLLDTSPDLDLRDIVVMAPDIQQYAPFIPALFEDIPHGVADRSLFRTNPCIARFQEFLQLLRSRCGWSEVLDLLSQEEVRSSFALSSSDLERIRRWVLDAGVRWGLSAKSREAEGAGFSEGSWRTGLERLLMGYGIDTEKEVAGVFPFQEIEGGEAQPLGSLCEFVAFLEKSVEASATPRELGGWAVFLVECARKLFGGRDDRDFLELTDIIRKLSEYGEVHRSRVDIQVIISWFETSLREARTASGFLTGKLTFCSMLPMRSVPFRSVCLMGMNGGEFPRKDSRPAFDLMHLKRLAGDRSVRDDDRYQFLEALLSARDNLCISYVGRSLKDNEEKAPAVVVSELLDVICRHYGGELRVEEHPLHGFSRTYFEDGSQRFSYDTTSLQIAKAMCGEKKEPGAWWTTSISREIEEIHFAELVQFFKNPQRYFLGKGLGLDVEERDCLVEETESFQVTGLEKYAVEQRLLRSCLEGEDEEHLLRLFQHQGRWPLGSMGEIGFAKLEREIRAFAGKIGFLDLGKKRADAAFSTDVDGVRVHGRLENCYERGVLMLRYGGLRGRDLLAGWLNHLAGCHLNGDGHQTHIITTDASLTFAGGGAAGPDLSRIVSLFCAGLQKPLLFFPEPAYAYCTQMLSSRARTEPIVKARRVFSEHREKGYQPAWSLLYEHESVESVVSENFVRLAEEIMLPLLMVQT